MVLDEWDVDEEMLSLIKEKLKHDQTFRYVFRRNLTKQIFKNLDKRLFSKSKTDHFVAVIRGVYGIGSTGVGKSSLGIELGLKYDPTFGMEKIDYTNEELLKKIKEHAVVGKQGAEKPQLFMRDESPASLRRRSQIEFSVVQEALRDARISLILIKPEPADLGLCHYIFEPLFFKKDFSEMKVCVVNPSTNKYRGFMNVPIHKDNPVWIEYMKHKKRFEEAVVNRQVGVFNARTYAKDFMATTFYHHCYRLLDDGRRKLVMKRLNKYLNQHFYNLTNQEREFIADDIKELNDTE